jgi:hypothetical protein
MKSKGKSSVTILKGNAIVVIFFRLREKNLQLETELLNSHSEKRDLEQTHQVLKHQCFDFLEKSELLEKHNKELSSMVINLVVVVVVDVV